MEHKISDTVSYINPPNVVFITTHLFQTLGQTDKKHWESLFYQFRLNLASRIVGSDERELLKLQAKIEYVNELKLFFEKLITSPPSKE